MGKGFAQSIVSGAKKAGHHMERASHHLGKAAYHAGKKELDVKKTSAFFKGQAQGAGKGAVQVTKRVAGAAYHEGKKEATRGSKELMSATKQRVKDEVKGATRKAFKEGVDYVTK
jgi:hypothetical protein